MLSYSVIWTLLLVGLWLSYMCMFGWVCFICCLLDYFGLITGCWCYLFVLLDYCWIGVVVIAFVSALFSAPVMIDYSCLFCCWFLIWLCCLVCWIAVWWGFAGLLCSLVLFVCVLVCLFPIRVCCSLCICCLFPVYFGFACWCYLFWVFFVCRALLTTYIIDLPWFCFTVIVFAVWVWVCLSFCFLF